MPAATPSRASDRRVLAVLAALVALVMAVALLPGVGAARAQEQEPTVERLFGDGRVETAVDVSQTTFPDGADVALLATGERFPDALAGGAAAAELGGPVLLAGIDGIPQATRDELARLQVERILVLGGTAALGEKVEEQAEMIVPDGVERIDAPERTATAASLSARVFAPGVEVAYVATSRAFADALAGGPAAAGAGGPVLLTEGDELAEPTERELRRLEPQEIVLLGGPAAVEDDVLEALGSLSDGGARRVSGPNRFATAAEVADDAFPGTRDVVFLASGEDFPDALAGTPAAAAADAPLLLAFDECVPGPTLDALKRLAPERVVLLGGRAALSEAVAGLEPCAGADPSPSASPSATASPTASPIPSPTASPSASPAPTSVPVTDTVIAEGLDLPWDVAFTPDGRTFVSERDTGNLLERQPDGTFAAVQQLDVNPQGEGGFLGIAVSPSWSEDGLLYAYTTTPNDNRVLRLRIGETPEPILTGIPRASNHDGGRIRFGPDGMLYVTTGDAGVADRAQDLDSIAGKILRLTPDGGIPADNPFDGSPVWSYGHRNPQGLAWDDDGRLFAAEFGPDRDDEVNLITAGSNYGWPEVTGMAGDPRFVDPIFVRQPPEAAWSGAAILSGSAIPQWEGDLFLGALRGQRLYRVDLADGAVADSEQLLVEEHGRIRTPAQAPDGSLWLLTSNGDDADRIVRLGPEQ